MYAPFEETLRRVITGDDASGQSITIIDGPPADAAVVQGRGGLLEIWTDTLAADHSHLDHVGQVVHADFLAKWIHGRAARSDA